MRRATVIGRATLAATAVLTLAAMSTAAEARDRGFRLRLDPGSAGAPAPLLPRPPERAAATALPTLLPVTLSSAGAPELRGSPGQVSPGQIPPDAGSLPASGASAPAGRKAGPPVRVAGPWCAPDRIVGVGAGFCAVN